MQRRSAPGADGTAPGAGVGCQQQTNDRRESPMKTIKAYGLAAMTAALLSIVLPVNVSAQQASAITIGATDLGGVVTGPGGPEAGVWVIAETTGLPTRFAKIVVTDDQGRFLIPDLPKTVYSVWVRGYGLVDSPKVQALTGKALPLKAVPAPNEAEA